VQKTDFNKNWQLKVIQDQAFYGHLKAHKALMPCNKIIQVIPRKEAAVAEMSTK